MRTSHVLRTLARYRGLFFAVCLVSLYHFSWRRSAVTSKQELHVESKEQKNHNFHRASPLLVIIVC